MILHANGSADEEDNFTMNHTAVRCHATSRALARIILLAGLLGSWQVDAATAARRTKDEVKTRASIVKDLAVLAENRPRKCITDKESESEARGWRQSTLQCAWKNRLQMRQWEMNESSDPARCVSKQATWWAWARSRAVAIVTPVVWNRAWSRQSLLDESGPLKRVAIIERSANGTWVATEWRWSPSPRTATRQWQAGRWKLLTDAAMEIRQSDPKDMVPPEAALLKSTWEKNLKGRAGEISGENGLWESDALCLRMETAGLSNAQLHLPYSKDDGRLEQRAAMQLQLARTYPKATWLTQFRLLPSPDSLERGGAKYEAIWMESAAVIGQLWMPTKADGAIVRARIAVSLPASKSSKADAAAVSRITRSIDHELIGLATIWTLDHE
jgi:hypothetical protein